MSSSTCGRKTNERVFYLVCEDALRVIPSVEQRQAVWHSLGPEAIQILDCRRRRSRDVFETVGIGSNVRTVS